MFVHRKLLLANIKANKEKQNKLTNWSVRLLTGCLNYKKSLTKKQQNCKINLNMINLLILKIYISYLQFFI